MRSELGTLNNSSNARGNNGIFSLVESQPILITIADPCVGTIINADGLFRINNPFNVAIGSSLREDTIEGPSDQVSAL